MKAVVTLSFVLLSWFSFSQEIIIENNKPDDVILQINYKGFEAIYDKLQSITDNINNTTIAIKRIDEIRQGQLIISTENMGKSFKGFNINPRPSLNIEVQRVMFTGNFFNTMQSTPIILSD